MTGVLRRFAVSLAFSTCCFLVPWVGLATSRGVYFARSNPLYTLILPVLCLEGALALGMLGTWELSRRRGWQDTPPAHMLFLAACLVPVGLAVAAGLRAFPGVFGWLRNPLAWPAALLLAIWPVRSAIRKPRTVSRFVGNGLLAASLVLAVVTVWGLVPVLRYSGSAFSDGALAAQLPGTPRIRVVWVIFDELSQAVAFEKRPGDLRLPNLDRLKAESFYAMAATSPADETLISMPALILGEELSKAVPLGPDNLLLRAPGRSAPFPWASVPNVFDSARGLGYNTALAGWYHPYGRVLNHSLTKCYWVAMVGSPGIEEPFETGPLAARRLADLPLIGYLRPELPSAHRRRERTTRYLFLLQHARELAADPSIGLALLHLSVPHPPAIYSRSKGALTTEGPLSYLDNVALADQALGALRQAMEQAGLWDRTAVLISADHGWRTRMWRPSPDWTAEEEAASRTDTSGVPFLLRLPGQTSGLAYDKPFNTVITRQVLTRILSGQLTAPEQLPGLIDSLAGNNLTN